MSENDQHIADLERLDQLRDRSIISQQEFETEKQQLLDNSKSPEPVVTRPIQDIPSPSLAEVIGRNSETKHTKDHQKPPQKKRWYTLKKGIVFACFTLLGFVPYWILTWRDTSDEWYNKGFGAAFAVLFVPYFAIWYVWFKKTWNIGLKLLFILPMAFCIVVVDLGIIFADYSGTNSTTGTTSTSSIAG